MSLEIDNGILLGLGFFETIEVYPKGPVFLNEHLNRLNRACQFFGLPQVTNYQVMSFIEKEANTVPYVLRITVTPKNIFTTTRNHPYLHFNRDMTVTISPLKRNPKDLFVYRKSIQYYQNIFEKQRASSKGFDEVLFLNTQNEVSEGSVSNIFWITNDTLYTPSIGCGLLGGVMRDWVITQTKTLQIPIVKGHFSIEQLQKADYVFITNSLLGIQPVSQIENIYYNNQKSTLISTLQQQLINYREGYSL